MGYRVGTPYDLQVRDRPLKPAKQEDFTDKCAPGDRLVDALSGVLFDTRRAPSARELRQVSDTDRVLADQARFDVRIGPDMSANTRVTLQMITVCRR